MENNIIMKTENTYHVPEESAGVVSICNNWKGIHLVILTKDKRHETNLRVGDVVTIKINSMNSFSVIHQPSASDEEILPTESLGFVIKAKEETTCIPFVQGEGTASCFVITMHKGSVQLNASTALTVPKEIYTDYIQTQIFPNDEVCVTIAYL